MAKPFLIWVGGKRKHLPKIIPLVPKSFNSYHEPFVGGGAVFFNLSPEKAFISDISPDLINIYKVVRDSPKELIENIRRCYGKDSKDFFNSVKEKYSFESTIVSAAEYIYLTKKSFRGLVTRKKDGKLKASCGDILHKFNEDNLYECSKLLQNTSIKCIPFTESLKYVKEGDFVFLDPPYHAVNNKSVYSCDFTEKNQIELRDLCLDLHKKGAKFLLTNSDSLFIEEIYKDFHIDKVLSINDLKMVRGRREPQYDIFIRNYVL